MSPGLTGEFADARPLAAHCAELLRSGPRPEERGEAIASWCRDLGSELAQEFAQVFTGGKLKVSVAVPETVKGAAVFEKIGPVACNALLRCGASDQTMLFSLDPATAIALTDASFGGSGAMPDSPPEQMPRSAAMLVEQCAGMIAQVIAQSNPVTANTAPGDARGDVLLRSESAARLKPFAPDAEVALFPVEIAMGEASWQVLLAVADKKLDTFLPGMAAPTRASARPARTGAHSAFAVLPLALEAVLGEHEISLDRLEKLAPGDEIPLAMPRELPLRLGELVLGHGTIGTLENRMALRLTRVPLAGENRGADHAGANQAPPDTRQQQQASTAPTAPRNDEIHP
ncbi:FliM/FliN family flagellar motor switch protein [Qipengyuania nanhaisediminis]|uniref:FliM/FliN family flagellar motor switch protein n=1 Tax=Qipengyuania nanhaisediminis TaxID=604088 RepID=UPI0038B3CB65